MSSHTFFLLVYHQQVSQILCQIVLEYNNIFQKTKLIIKFDIFLELKWNDK